MIYLEIAYPTELRHYKLVVDKTLHMKYNTIKNKCLIINIMLIYISHLKNLK